MTLETLQAMSDDELNDLAAIKILWGGIVNVRSDSFTPCTDMNDAMKLANNIIDDITEFNVNINEYRSVVIQMTVPRKTKRELITVYEKLENISRAITIASILAKGSE